MDLLFRWWGDKPCATIGSYGGTEDMVSSRVLIEDMDAEGLFKPTQFKHQGMMVGELL